MLSDPSLIGNDRAEMTPDVDDWFDLDWWRERGLVRAADEGRGSLWFIDLGARQLALRHYRRGGLMARLTTDRFWFTGATATRAFQEWHLLYLMRFAGLQVPAPVACRYRTSGRYTYTADLLTVVIPAVTSLAARLGSAPLPLSGWIAVGRSLRRFHEEGVYHADLNAHNVLLSAAFDVWLVDFDRGQLRKPGLWCDGNLVRLRRSIEKLTDALPADRFSEADWASMLSGYFAAAAVPLTSS